MTFHHFKHLACSPRRGARQNPDTDRVCRLPHCPKSFFMGADISEHACRIILKVEKTAVLLRDALPHTLLQKQAVSLTSFVQGRRICPGALRNHARMCMAVNDSGYDPFFPFHIIEFPFSLSAPGFPCFAVVQRRHRRSCPPSITIAFRVRHCGVHGVYFSVFLKRFFISDFLSGSLFCLHGFLKSPNTRIFLLRPPVLPFNRNHAEVFRHHIVHSHLPSDFFFTTSRSAFFAFFHRGRSGGDMPSASAEVSVPCF